MSAQTVVALRPAKDVQETIARTVRSLLAANGLRAKDLAAAVGMKEGRLSERLNGKANILATDVAAWAEFLGVEPGDLYRDLATLPTAAGGSGPDQGTTSPFWDAPVLTLPVRPDIYLQAGDEDDEADAA